MRTFYASITVLFVSMFFSYLSGWFAPEILGTQTSVYQVLVLYLGAVFGYICCIILDLRDILTK